MFGSPRPSTLLWNSVDDLVHQLPLMKDGTEEGFHQARVAIRRTREALSLLRGEAMANDLADIDHRLGRAFKVLGKVRDADTGYQLIDQLERRFPVAPVALASLRRKLRDEQLKTRRKAIKTIEKLDFDTLSRRARDVLHQIHVGRRDWRAVLRHHVAMRAEDAHNAIDRAGGVYFPNRVHSARVALKQLRYALELATATGSWQGASELRRLKKTQEALGDAHDRQVLMARLDALAAEVPGQAAEIEALQQCIHAELMALHTKYVGWRPQLLEICEVCARVPRRSAATTALMVAGATVPSLLLLRKRG